MSQHIKKGLSGHTPHLFPSFTMKAISSADEAKVISLYLSLRVFLLCHKILKSTSVDCNKINIVMVMVRIMMWESPGDSHAVAIQWVRMVKDPPATILIVHTVTSKYTFCYQ